MTLHHEMDAARHTRKAHNAQTKREKALHFGDTEKELRWKYGAILHHASHTLTRNHGNESAIVLSFSLAKLMAESAEQVLIDSRVSGLSVYSALGKHMHGPFGQLASD